MIPPHVDMREFVDRARVLLDITEGGHWKGYAGDFARKLCELALKCDDDNLDRLSLGFPAMACVVEVWRERPELVRELARGSAAWREDEPPAGKADSVK